MWWLIETTSPFRWYFVVIVLKWKWNPDKTTFYDVQRMLRFHKSLTRLTQESVIIRKTMWSVSLTRIWYRIQNQVLICRDIEIINCDFISAVSNDSRKWKTKLFIAEQKHFIDANEADLTLSNSNWVIDKSYLIACINCLISFSVANFVYLLPAIYFIISSCLSIKKWNLRWVKQLNREKKNDEQKQLLFFVGVFLYSFFLFHLP